MKLRPSAWKIGARTACTTISAILFAAAPQAAIGAALSPEVRQLVVAVAPDWDSHRGKLQLFEKSGSDWTPVCKPWPVLFGKNGLVWGRGELGGDEPGEHKNEHDKRAPAGVFKIGRIYTYDQALPAGSDYPFHTVTNADAWVDDSSSPNYNRFITIPDPANPPPWFEKEKMRLNDFAYRWLVEIRHNSDPPTPGGGSAIFFPHPAGRRQAHGRMHDDGGRRSGKAGSLAASQSRSSRPLCSLRSEYEKKWKAWGLPSPVGSRRGA